MSPVVLIEQAAARDGEVIRAETPAGLIATAAHIGPYDRLGQAHEAIREWCKANGPS
jgi:effector-binding domain-containing protein